MRTQSLAHEVRDTMGRQLAAEVSSYVAPPPPEGVPPEVLLQVVLTERLRRASRQTPGRVGTAPSPTARLVMPESGTSSYAPPVAPTSTPAVAGTPDGFAPPG